MSARIPARLPMLAALHAAGPASDRKSQMMLYGQFVGSWEARVFEHLTDGSTQERKGEWHFGWVLEGRAIQDVFIVPPRAARGARKLPIKGNRYGTTIRVYDPQKESWQITWINPVTQAFNRMTGR